MLPSTVSRNVIMARDRLMVERGLMKRGGKRAAVGVGLSLLTFILCGCGGKSSDTNLIKATDESPSHSDGGRFYLKAGPGVSKGFENCLNSKDVQTQTSTLAYPAWLYVTFRHSTKRDRADSIAACL